MIGFVRLADGTAVAQVLPQVSTLVADSPEVSAADRSAFIEQQTGGFDQIITMIQILLALAILIAVLGVINTLALSVLERTRELGLLRAVGLRRAQTMRMVTVEAVVISVFGALLGVAVGAGLGAAVVQALQGRGHHRPGPAVVADGHLPAAGRPGRAWSAAVLPGDPRRPAQRPGRHRPRLTRRSTGRARRLPVEPAGVGGRPTRTTIAGR